LLALVYGVQNYSFIWNYKKKVALFLVQHPTFLLRRCRNGGLEIESLVETRRIVIDNFDAVSMKKPRQIYIIPAGVRIFAAANMHLPIYGIYE
jgi:hypothetical protein